MRATLLTAFAIILATTVVLLSGTALRQADAAMPISARPSAAAFVQKAASVCGSNGCVRVQTQRVVKHQKAGNVVPK